MLNWLWCVLYCNAIQWTAYGHHTWFYHFLFQNQNIDICTQPPLMQVTYSSIIFIVIINIVVTLRMKLIVSLAKHSSSWIQNVPKFGVFYHFTSLFWISLDSFGLPMSPVMTGDFIMVYIGNSCDAVIQLSLLRQLLDQDWCVLLVVTRRISSERNGLFCLKD